MTILLKEQAEAKMSLSLKEVERWQTLVGGSCFSAVYPLVPAMAAAQRWPQLTGKVYLASLEFINFEFNQPRQELDLILDVDEKRKGWYWYSFKANSISTPFFSGRAVISNHQNLARPQILPPSPTGEKICRLSLDEQRVIQYLDISGDPNPIHRQGTGNRESVYPGLLLLGQVETALRKHLNISLTNYKVKVKFHSPVFVGEAVDVAIVPGVSARFEILVSNRVAATIGCN